MRASLPEFRQSLVDAGTRNNPMRDGQAVGRAEDSRAGQGAVTSTAATKTQPPSRPRKPAASAVGIHHPIEEEVDLVRAALVRQHANSVLLEIASLARLPKFKRREPRRGEWQGLVEQAHQV